MYSTSVSSDTITMTIASSFGHAATVRRGAGALNLASVVAVPHRKQMSALSAISVPQLRHSIDALTKQGTHGRHDNQNEAERTDNRRPRRQIEPQRQIHAERRHQRPHRPADRET